MNADAFRQLYDYHFAENRKLWDFYVPDLSPEQFTQETGYSHGSVRNQLAHLISVDEAWFSGLRRVELPEQFELDGVTDRATMRAYWDSVEHQMREYLAQLRDDMLFTQPLTGEDEGLMLWQVLLHVVNHGTDHRAQILRLLNDLGVKTGPQDYIFYVYEHPSHSRP